MDARMYTCTEWLFLKVEVIIYSDLKRDWILICEALHFYGNRKHVFLSHSSVDKDEVRKLAKDLERSADLFFDEKSIIPGQSITKSINDGLLGSDAIVLVLSKNSINSDWVLREYSYAIHVKKVIIPVLLHDCIIPPMLADIKYIRAYDQSVDVYDSVIKALDILVTE